MRLLNPKLGARMPSHWFNANYQSGTGFERYIKKLLREQGYFVTRSAGSKGAADLVAIKDGIVYLIQCKSDLRPLDDEHLQAILAPARQGSTFYNHIVPLQVKRWQRRIHIIDLRTNIELDASQFLRPNAQ